MRNYKTITILLLFIFIAVAVAAAGGCAKKPAPKLLPETPEAMTAQPRIVIGYCENPWPGTPEQTGSFPSMKTFAKSMSAVGPFWYKATADGTLETRDSQQVYDTARSLGLKMYPLVTNKTGSTDAILGDPAIRTKTIDNIIKVVQDKNYDGINIDFELLPPKHRDNLTAFMAELYPKMKAINKTVIISIFPKVDVHESITAAYNYPELAKNADFLQIMLYDKHWATSEPGAIAPVDWYERNLQYAIDNGGGANKIIAGVSAYGYDWQKGGEGETITYVNAIVKAEQKGAKILYDDKAQAPHFSYGDHEVWFENKESTAAKLDIVAKYKPAGIAIWRLGQEQPEIWQVIDQKFPKQQ